VPPRGLDLGVVGVQAMDQGGWIGLKGRGELAVAAAEMDDQAASNARGLQDLPSRGLFGRGRL